MLRRAAMPAVAAVASAAFLFSHATSPWRPATAGYDTGWWSFFDQGRYLRSALAWAAGDLRPDEHWYLPGYPLLAAPFVRITPADPFLLPDLALLLVSLWLTAAIAARLAPAWPDARLAGAAIFLATCVLVPDVLAIWVIPWTTTPATALTLACLLATLRVLQEPIVGRSWRAVAAAALTAAALPVFRPSDGAVVLSVCGAAIALRLATAWRDPALILKITLPALLGGAAIVAATLAIHVLVHGRALGPYLEGSAAIGFEWRILPLQWVQIVLSARPLLPEPNGLISRMPWIAPGLAGMLACLLAPPAGADRRGHALVIVLATLQMAQYLAYRDLHPPGLWRHLNYHYFKWLFPVFGLYTVLLIAVVRRRPAVGLAAATTVLLVALPWRAELELSGPAFPLLDRDGTIALPPSLGVRDAVLIPADGSWDAIYHGEHAYRFGTDPPRLLGPVGSIVAYPVPEGVLLAPVTPLPTGDGRARLDARVTPHPDGRVRLARQTIVYGLPCFLSSRLYRIPSCQRTP